MQELCDLKGEEMCKSVRGSGDLWDLVKARDVYLLQGKGLWKVAVKEMGWTSITSLYAVRSG